MVNNDNIRWQHEGLIKASENVHDVNYEVEWRLEDEVYAEERSNLSDLALSVKSAFKESQRLRYPNSIHEGELEVAGQKEALGALREADRRAKFIMPTFITVHNFFAKWWHGIEQVSEALRSKNAQGVAALIEISLNHIGFDGES